jgi:phosphopantothenoylcysteine decarboxylase/phosphopantothenate--cysteine ligase
MMLFMRKIFADKRIVLGVTGSIAAYKAAELIRRIKDLGATVQVVMTKAACEFITPLTLQTLSGQPVAIELLDADEESAMGHIKLARWADWVVIAPASANTIARLANGQTDDLISALCLATEAPIAIAPAMNNKMWSNPATQANMNVLRQRGLSVFGPASGDQACGEQGEGRLLEPNLIIESLSRLMVPKLLAGKRILITAGPTHEPIDPVRYIGNRSSGKMGYAIATAAQEAGAEVTLISGPVNLMTPSSVNRIDVKTAQEMHDTVMKHISDADIFISCAAVADFTPMVQAENKIKKTNMASLTIELKPTQDIVANVAQLHSDVFTVGFAAETQDLALYAQAKLKAKNLNMIAANQVGDNQGFGKDDNALTVYWHNGHTTMPLTSKTQLARQLMTLIIEQFYAKNTAENIG